MNERGFCGQSSISSNYQATEIRKHVKKCDLDTHLESYLPRHVSLHDKRHFDDEFGVLSPQPRFC